jgi:hypothetical protein
MVCLRCPHDIPSLRHPNGCLDPDCSHEHKDWGNVWNCSCTDCADAKLASYKRGTADKAAKLAAKFPQKEKKEKKKKKK